MTASSLQQNPIRIMHIITSLDVGGGEMMLYRLLQQIDPNRFDNHIVSLIKSGLVGDKLRKLGFPVQSLDMIPSRISLKAFLTLLKMIHQQKPNIIQTWLYHADLMGGLAGFLSGTTVIWSIHNSTLDPKSSLRSTRVVVWFLTRLSSWIPKRIISCSLQAREVHVIRGYDPDKMILIPNGYDLSYFKVDKQARESIRRELAIAPDVPLIGMVARFHPQKDFHNFIEAALIFSRNNESARFLLCGKESDWENTKLVNWLAENGLKDRFILTGQREDIPNILNGLDIFSLSSAFGEAFPLTIGEAMACGVPCVATEVGDTAYLLGDTGITVPPRDPRALAEGWEKILVMSTDQKHKLGERARQRIQQNFSIDRITSRYETLYKQVYEENI